MNLNFTKGVITRDEAFALAPDYVQMVESKHGDGFFDFFNKVIDKFNKMKKGQACVTCHDGVWLRCKVSSVKHNDYRAVDGPLVRIGNGEFTWRVDGDAYAFPIEE